MKITRIMIRGVAAGLAAASWSLYAQSVSTEPMGVVQLDLLGNSDTIVSLPLHRLQEFEGRVESVDGETITVLGNPGWSENEFAAGTHYVLIASGSHEGMYYTVLGNNEDTLLLDLVGDNLDGVQSEAMDGEGMGDFVKLIPYWTLDTLFPDGDGVHASSSPLFRSTVILLPDHASAGVDLAADRSYFYYSGTGFQGPGWYRVGNMNDLAGRVRLVPDSYLTVRHNVEEDTRFAVVGAVGMTAFSVPIGTIMANTRQDNFVALPIPVAVTLAESQLFESGAFTSSTSPLFRVDNLYVFDNQTRARFKSASSIYFHYTGTGFAGTGWYRVGDMSRTVDDDEIFQPGHGFIIRKGATPDPVTNLWSAVPPYLED